MHIGSELVNASLEELKALPSDATNYRIIVVNDRLYVCKKNGGWIELSSSESVGNVPVGTILPFYDFDGAVSFDTSVYAYCNGQTINDIASLLHGKELPDLSNRYIVGFGTDGGGDIGSSSWLSAPIGNSSHVINISHAHAMPLHTHSGPSHSHSGAYHSHPLYGSTGYVYGTGANRFQVDIGGHSLPIVGGGSDQGNHTHSLYGLGTDVADSGYTGYAGTGQTGSSGDGNTGDSLSASQSIQPRSIRCRYIMRYK